VLAFCIGPATLIAQQKDTDIQFDFYGDTISFQLKQSFNVDFKSPLSPATIEAFYQKIITSNYNGVLSALLSYKEKYKPDDWLYYQLIRKTAQQISPKAENYNRYTLYKWFLLTKFGYDNR
jgi:hypothetical protein